ncbi:MAG TPA: hypothetical protein VHN99_07720, partial [Deinococcales bacterium]|nr:hypothetical protein [Deinococcales bacterium]
IWGNRDGDFLHVYTKAGKIVASILVLSEDNEVYCGGFFAVHYVLMSNIDPKGTAAKAYLQWVAKACHVGVGGKVVGGIRSRVERDGAGALMQTLVLP